MGNRRNRAVARQIVERVLNRGHLDVVDKVVAEDMIDHNGPPSFGAGRNGWRTFFAELRRAFPDLEVSIDQEVADGDKVVQHLTCSGTHMGPLLGIPPTGRRVVWNETHILRIKNGRIAEHWGSEDMMGLFNQLGVVEVPPPPPPIELPPGA